MNGIGKAKAELILCTPSALPEPIGSYFKLFIYIVILSN